MPPFAPSVSVRHLGGPASPEHRYREIARQLGIRESAVRYRLARLAKGGPDGRADKAFAAEAHDAVIRHWLERAGSARGVNLQALHEHLVEEHGYTGS
jgi:DNA-binding Lrp family transcriptional regulator